MNLPEFSIEGSTAIVTGASRGIGRSIALVLAEAGADVGIAARSEAPLNEVAAQVRDLGRKCVAVPTDITKEEDVARLVSSVIDGLGRVDILVNNAGIAIVKPMVPLPGFKPAGAAELPGFFEPTSVDEWDQVLDVNLKSMMLTSKYAIPKMIDAGGGSIINMSSIDGLRGSGFGGFDYSVSKGGVIALTTSMAVQHGRENIRVNCIAPGYLYTPMVAGILTEETRDLRRRAGPLGTEGTAWDVAWAAVFLASDEARWVSGVVLPVDAGLLATTPLAMLPHLR